MKIEHFWVVTKPSPNDTQPDILFQSTIQGMQNQFAGGLKGNEILGIWTTKAEAQKVASEALSRTNKPLSIQNLAGSWDHYKSGEKEAGYVTLNSADAVHAYVSDKLGRSVKSVAEIQKGKNFPHNRSNPYYHDKYEVTLDNGFKFNLKRQYGTPSWAGNVQYVERITINQ